MGVVFVALMVLGAVAPKKEDPTGAGSSSASEPARATTTTVELSPDERAIASGMVALCHNGDYSDNTDFSKTCNAGDGIERWLGTFGQCADGSYIAISKSASCSEGFSKVMPADFVPSAGPGDLAKCQNGVFSDNTDLESTCSSNGGIASWLAPYGECVDGTTIKMSKADACRDHDGFARLKDPEFVPVAEPSDIAQCDDGTFSDNRDLSSTCNSRGGVAAWLAQYGRCANGDIVLLGVDTCAGSSFQELLPGYVPETTTTAPAASPAPPVTDPATLDLMFTVLMQSEGIDPVSAKAAALSFCTVLENNGGDARLSLVQAAVLAVAENIDAELIGRIVGAGVPAYCPQYADAMAAAFE